MQHGARLLGTLVIYSQFFNLNFINDPQQNTDNFARKHENIIFELFHFIFTT